MRLPISTEYRYITHVSEIEELPNLTPAQVYEALSYYHDHQVEIERDIEESRAERLIERYGLKVAENGRIIADEMHNQLYWLQAFK